METNLFILGIILIDYILKRNDSFLQMFKFIYIGWCISCTKSYLSCVIFYFYVCVLSLFSFFLNKFIYLFIFLFSAVLGLRFCARAFSSCGEWGPLFIVVLRPLTVVASLVAEHRLQTRRLSSCGSRA